MKALRVLFIIVGAMTITALGLDAADTWQGSSGTLLGQLLQTTRESDCPEGMVVVTASQNIRCVDKYEVSPGDGCPISNPASPFDTEANMAQAACRPVSQEAALPWRYVSREEAMRLCARAGKRLPTAAEWYEIAIDTSDEPCLAGRELRPTGEVAACVSAVGAVDTVGNVWEWVVDDVIDGQWQGRQLPDTGYVLQVDQAGIATITGSSGPSREHDEAYFWSDSGGVYGMIRGGFYGSRADAGVVAVHAATPPSFTGEAVGFRCVR